MIFLVNTFLGFLVAQAQDVLMRSRPSANSPQKFSWEFFWKDTKMKIICSLILSIALSILIYLNIEDLGSIIGQEWGTASGLVYIVVGFAPEKALQWAKKKYGFLQPEQVGEHKRK